MQQSFEFDIKPVQSFILKFQPAKRKYQYMIFKANTSQNPIARVNIAFSTEGPGFGGAKIFRAASKTHKGGPAVTGHRFSLQGIPFSPLEPSMDSEIFRNNAISPYITENLLHFNTWREQ